ncbi:hypothetical protein [Modestobacter sp. NPDC049651]|uniref:hypothetical protein n=1 Tax=unclassified Modestobacter TaxID=2643866 RepID=UPI0033F236A1
MPKGLAAVLRRTAPTDDAGSDTQPLPADAMDWSWPPYAPVPHPGRAQFDTQDWAPSSVVWHPYVRVGRWTVVYRRSA